MEKETDASKPCDLLDALPRALQLTVTSFCSVHDLKATMVVSRKYCELARSDDIWETRLHRFLESHFDDAFTPQKEGEWLPTPISKRPDWRHSTTFCWWYIECRDADCCSRMGVLDDPSLSYVEDYHDGPDHGLVKEETDAIQWLLEDVELWRYYFEALKVKNVSEERFEDMCMQTNRCSQCFEKDWACTCYGDESSDTGFEDMCDDDDDDFDA